MHKRRSCIGDDNIITAQLSIHCRLILQVMANAAVLQGMVYRNNLGGLGEVVR
jgi:hypothetical protein